MFLLSVRGWAIRRYLLGATPETLPGRLRHVGPPSFTAAFEGESPACAAGQLKLKVLFASMPYNLKIEVVSNLERLGEKDGFAKDMAATLKEKEEKGWIKPQTQRPSILDRMIGWVVSHYVLDGKPATLAKRLRNITPQSFAAAFDVNSRECGSRRVELQKMFALSSKTEVAESLSHLGGKGSFAQEMANVLARG